MKLATFLLPAFVMLPIFAQPKATLDKAAIEAVSRWRYAPLLLNGIPMRFVLTVTLNFSLTEPTTKDVG